jgi:aldehyde dehydrogenase (NAD+)
MAMMGEEIKKIFDEIGLDKINSGVFYGEWAPIEGRERMTSYSPIDGSKIASATTTTKEDYEKVIKKAKESFNLWSDIPAPKRGLVVREIGNELRKYKEILGKLVSIEVGKTISEGEGEVQEMIDIADFALGISRQFYGSTMVSERENHRLYEQWQPIGPIGIITSFNFPCSVWAWNSMIASTAGDVCVWKPSSKGILTAITTIKIANEATERLGYPPIFFLVVGRGGEVGEWMSSDTRLPLISFTGSISTGKRISERVAARLGRSILELGGNNAAIVTGKADMDAALKGVAFGAIATSGQRCTTTRRLILHESIYDEFLAKLKRLYEKAKIGNPLEEGILMGPMIDESATEKYLKAIKRAKEEGGKLIYGGENIKMQGDGQYVKPTLIEATPDMEIVKEETFAPILYVMKYKTIEEALEINNSVPQGLSSAIFTKDVGEEEYFLSHKGSDCGLANVNASTAGAEIGGAFGGEKETGGGRESGSDSWKSYMRRQTVTINYGKGIPLSQGVKFEINEK